MNKKIAWILVAVAIVVIAAAGASKIFTIKESKENAKVPENVRTVNVIGDNFSFSPNEIKMKKGEQIKIIFTNAGSYPHNWEVDEFDAKTETVGTGQASEVIFTADKTGTFEYYCIVDGHREKGMKGNLIVEE